MLLINRLIAPAAVMIFIGFGFCCYSQQMVQTPGDIILLSQNAKQFIGKPLKDLFKEIKPRIRLVLARGGWAEEAPLFTFFFTTGHVYDRCRRQDKFPLRLRVYIKEPFEWTVKRNENKGHYLDWTRVDEEKYANLIIGAIRVIGEYDASDYDYNIFL